MRLIVLLRARAALAADAAVREGLLARWWSRSERMPGLPVGSHTLLRDCFDLPGPGIAVAALTRELDGFAPDDAVWLRADPAHVRADMTSARMLACGDLGLSREESDELLAELKPLFGDAGLPIEGRSPARWYVRCAGDIGMPDFVPPESALGDDLAAHLPAGVPGKRWRTLLNEAQIVLHNHPLNAKRKARGQVTINSVWFWGAGRRPEWVHTEVATAVSDDAVVQALALRASIPCFALGDGFNATRTCDVPAGDVQLLDLRRARGVEIERTWLAPIDAALRKRRIHRLDLLFESGERCRVRRRDRWRWWRAIRLP